VQVDPDAPLVPVEHREEAGARAEQASRSVAVDGLDLDHVRAQVAQDQSAGRPHDHVRELDDAQAPQGKRCAARS
jgi:hypothetical protein